MQAQKEAPPDMQCKDKFLLQSAVASGEYQGVSAKEITPEMFIKESGNQVEECKLRVSYVAPHQPPSPVREGSDEGTSPRVSVSENGTANTLDSNTVSRAYVEHQENTPECPKQNDGVSCGYYVGCFIEDILCTGETKINVNFIYTPRLKTYVADMLLCFKKNWAGYLYNRFLKDRLLMK